MSYLGLTIVAVVVSSDEAFLVLFTVDIRHGHEPMSLCLDCKDVAKVFYSSRTIVVSNEKQCFVCIVGRKHQSCALKSSEPIIAYSHALMYLIIQGSRPHKL